MDHGSSTDFTTTDFTDNDVQQSQIALVVEETEEMVMDYSNEFTTYDVFPDRYKMKEWIDCTAKRNAMVLVVLKSYINSSDRNPRIIFGCERSGAYKEYKGKKSNSVRLTSTKKCNCPFRLKGVKLTSGEWSLDVICGVHNHCAFYSSEGHSYVGRLKEDEKKLAVEMYKNMVKPKAILHTIKQNNPLNSTTIKTVYNALSRHKKMDRAGRSQIQYLLSVLKGKNYFEWHRSTLDGSDVITDIFWAHPTSIDLLRTFSHLLVMDCTYKTNKYRMPLLEIVGVTSTNQTFCVAIAYLVSERENYYVWALNRLKLVMIDCDIGMPNVIVTDREIALINAINIVFPQAAHILCKWHIKKNILSFVQRRITGMKKEVKKEFFQDWTNLCESGNIEQYHNSLQDLYVKYNDHPKFVKYVTDNWLDTWKDRFVCAWIDNFMHFGNYTSNRAESAHAKLKKHLATSQCNFERAWESMHSLLELSFTELKASFETSLLKVSHVYHKKEFKNLRGVVSLAALELIHSELLHINSNGTVDDDLCECAIRKTHGLPCFHALAKLGRNAEIPLDLIHVHWTRLHIIKKGEEKDCNLKKKFEEMVNEIIKLELPHQVQAYKKIKEIVYPRTSTLSSPISKVKTHGRSHKKIDTSTKRFPSAFELGECASTQCSVSKKQKIDPCILMKKEKLNVRRPKNINLGAYETCVPNEWKPYIEGIVDVDMDGNCGFRCVASFLGLGEDRWWQVRKELMEELEEHTELYDRVFCEKGRSTYLLNVLNHEFGGAEASKWMIMPDIGYIIATKYNLVVFSINEHLSLTIPPLKGKIPSATERCEFGICHVNNTHFVQVILQANHPIPPIYNKWFENRRIEVESWEHILQERRQQWKEMENYDKIATWD